MLKLGGEALNGDTTSPSICVDNHLSIAVFDLCASGRLECILAGETIGTLIT